MREEPGKKLERLREIANGFAIQSGQLFSAVKEVLVSKDNSAHSPPELGGVFIGDGRARPSPIKGAVFEQTAPPLLRKGTPPNSGGEWAVFTARSRVGCITSKLPHAAQSLPGCIEKRCSTFSNNDRSRR